MSWSVRQQGWKQLTSSKSFTGVGLIPEAVAVLEALELGANQAGVGRSH